MEQFNITKLTKLAPINNNSNLTKTIIQSKLNEQKEEFIANNDDKDTLNNELELAKTTVKIEEITTDEELLAIFLEEARELEIDINKNFALWKKQPTNVELLKKLQRYLHTMKGGARMVGIHSIGDLTHEIETIYQQFIHQEMMPSTAWANVMQVAQDILSLQIEYLENQTCCFFSDSTIEQLHAFIKLQKLPDNARLAMPNLEALQQANTKAVATDFSTESLPQATHDTSVMPKMLGDFGEFQETTDSNNEAIRVPASMMEQMINLSSEALINRARIDKGVNRLTNHIEEMDITVRRLAEQLRRMDIELEAQILSQIDDKNLLENENFDPLEMDKYSSLNQLSKSLAESASDLLDIKATLLEKVHENESLLLQLSRTQTELQDNLISTRIVPFSNLVSRLQRIVRQTANEVNKQVKLTIVNADYEIDKNILERITSPLEHMLRNAVDHGIETVDERRQAEKNSIGQISLSIARDGSEIVIELTDDGRGIDVESVREKAISQGLIDPNDDSLTDTDIIQYIFNAGLSTTNQVTQISGRGVGMDVVRSEIRQLGGIVSVDSSKGKGSRFIMRVPLTLALADALVVRVADNHYVIPLVQIERVEQVNSDDLLNYYQSERHTFSIADTEYRLRSLNEILTGNAVNNLSITAQSTLPVIIIKNQARQNLAVQVDKIVGSRLEVVVKPLGKQLSQVSGISSATIMADGSIMLILDLIALLRNAPIHQVSKIDTQNPLDSRKKILIIDDSVTVRKVTSRLLQREGFAVMVAKDGIDALKILQEYTPDLMLLDIEMPRMDGFEVAKQVRHNERLKDTPIIMITSRTGEKHREKAMEMGVNDYLGKPFQENILLECINKKFTSG